MVLNKVNVSVVPIDKLEPNPWNPNEQSKFTFEKEMESIKQYGFLDPIAVRPKGDKFEIVDGEHRWRAATALGLEEVLINNLGDISDAMAKQLTLIANETRGEADSQKLAVLVKTISELSSLEETKRLLPFSSREIDSMLVDMIESWDELDEQDIFKEDNVVKDETKLARNNYELWLTEMKLKEKDHPFEAFYAGWLSKIVAYKS